MQRFSGIFGKRRARILAGIAALGLAVAACSPGHLYLTNLNAVNGHGAFDIICNGQGPCTIHTGAGTIDGQSFSLLNGQGGFEDIHGHDCTSLPCPRGGGIGIAGNALYGGQPATYEFVAADTAGAGYSAYSLTIAPSSGSGTVTATHTLQGECASCVHVMLYPAVPTTTTTGV